MRITCIINANANELQQEVQKAAGTEDARDRWRCGAMLNGEHRFIFRRSRVRRFRRQQSLANSLACIHAALSPSMRSTWPDANTSMTRATSSMVTMHFTGDVVGSELIGETGNDAGRGSALRWSCGRTQLNPLCNPAGLPS
jgi:hypothetical protein